MNARDNTPLRTLIAAHLDEAGECTALAIAKAVGKGDVPSVVVKELNAMRTDGQVECEQRKKEMLYWLAVPLAQIAGGAHEAPATPASDLPSGVRDVINRLNSLVVRQTPASDLPPGVREGTRAAQIYRTLPEFGAEPMTAREIATATGCAKGLIAPVLTAMDKASQVTRIPAGVEGCGLYGYTRLPPAGGDSEGGETDIAAAKDIPPPQYDPEEVAFAATTDAEQDQQAAHLRLIGVLADIRAAVGDPEGKLMQDELVEHIRAIYDLGEAHKRACMEWETAMMAAVGEDGVNDVVGKIASLQHKVSMQDAELFKQAGVIVDLRNQLGEARAAHHALQESPTLESIEPAGYLVRATKRAPRITAKQETAVAAALAAARNGSGRGEVFALVPVGKAVRGAEWRPA